MSSPVVLAPGQPPTWLQSPPSLESTSTAAATSSATPPPPTGGLRHSSSSLSPKPFARTPRFGTATRIRRRIAEERAVKIDVSVHGMRAVQALNGLSKRVATPQVGR